MSRSTSASSRRALSPSAERYYTNNSIYIRFHSGIGGHPLAPEPQEPVPSVPPSAKPMGPPPLRGLKGGLRRQHVYVKSLFLVDDLAAQDCVQNFGR
jgi:hypothetical protein